MMDARSSNSSTLDANSVNSVMESHQRAFQEVLFHGKIKINSSYSLLI